MRGTEGVSDSGSRMGAAGRCKVRSEAVTVPSWKSLTCRNVPQQQLCETMRSVRIEGSGVQIPSAPPSSCRSDGLFEFWLFVGEPMWVSFLATFTWTGHFPGQGVGVQIYLSCRVSAFRLT
jgi:hypothetical protein